MDLRNKRFLTTVRVIFGLFMIFSGVSGMLMGPDAESIPAEMAQPTRVLWDSGIFQMVKVTEIVAGLMLVVGFLPALAAIFLAPVAIGIVVVNAMLSPAYLPMGLVVVALNAYLGYAYWDTYKALFERAPKKS